MEINFLSDILMREENNGHMPELTEAIHIADKAYKGLDLNKKIIYDSYLNAIEEMYASRVKQLEENKLE